MQSLAQLATKRYHQSIPAGTYRDIIPQHVMNRTVREPYYSSPFSLYNRMREMGAVYDYLLHDNLDKESVRNRFVTIIDLIHDISIIVRDRNLPTLLPLKKDYTYLNKPLGKINDNVRPSDLQLANAFFYSGLLSAVSKDVNIVQNLRTMFGMIYGIKIEPTFRIGYKLSAETPNGISIMCLDKYCKLPADIYNLQSIHDFFMLVTVYMGMVDQPDRHVFSINCKCIVCRLSPEYQRLLDVPYEISYQLEPVDDDGDNFTFVNLGVDLTRHLVNALLVCVKNTNTIFVYSKGAVVRAQTLEARLANADVIVDRIQNYYGVRDTAGVVVRNLSENVLLTLSFNEYIKSINGVYDLTVVPLGPNTSLYLLDVFLDAEAGE